MRDREDDAERHSRHKRRHHNGRTGSSDPVPIKPRRK
jgi:hypothetical protein